MITGGHFLDGREFTGTLRSVGKLPLATMAEDVFIFRDGKIKSHSLLLQGFPESPYLAFLEKDASEADRLVLRMTLKKENSNPDELLHLNAIIEKNEIDIQMEIVREHQPSQFLRFEGKSASKRESYTSFAS